MNDRDNWDFSMSVARRADTNMKACRAKMFHLKHVSAHAFVIVTLKGHM